MTLDDRFLIVAHTTIFADMALRASGRALAKQMNARGQAAHDQAKAAAQFAGEIHRVAAQTHRERVQELLGDGMMMKVTGWG